MAYIVYKKAGLKFETLETFAAGLSLTGAEAKSVRKGQGSLEGSRVIVRGGEAFIIGLSIPPYQQANTPAGYTPDHPRKLLLKKSEIVELMEGEAKKGLTIVPLEVYNSGRYIKARIAIVRGKNKSDKRETLKRKDDQRDMDRAMKERGRAKRQ